MNPIKAQSAFEYLITRTASESVRILEETLRRAKLPLLEDSRAITERASRIGASMAVLSLAKTEPRRRNAFLDWLAADARRVDPHNLADVATLEGVEPVDEAAFPESAAPVPEGVINVLLLGGTHAQLWLSQGSEYCWGKLDNLSDLGLITPDEFRARSADLERAAGPEGLPRTAERH